MINNKFAKFASIVGIIALLVSSILLFATVGKAVEIRQAEKTAATTLESRFVEAVVYGLTQDGTGVIFADTFGNLWSADDEGLTMNQKVILEINNNGTADLTDDEILNVWLA